MGCLELFGDAAGEGIEVDVDGRAGEIGQDGVGRHREGRRRLAGLSHAAWAGSLPMPPRAVSNMPSISKATLRAARMASG